MGLSLRSPRYIHRILAVTAVLLFVLAALGNWDRQAGFIKSVDRPRANRLWTSTVAATGQLLPHPHNRTHISAESKVSQSRLMPESDRGLMNASFVSLVRNSELDGILSSIADVEARFNRNYNYDWVFLNDDDFTEEFRVATTNATSGRARYGKIDVEQWSYPPGIDQQLAEKGRQEMGLREDIPYGSSESYRHMCRYQSGFFYRHPLVQEYDWYWRVEPGIEILCDLPYDPFRYMAERGQKYAFVISLNEISDTIPTLWKHVRGFMEHFPQHISNNSHMAFLSEDGGTTLNHCQFWDNFEIASLEWYRSPAYNDFFAYLDRSGGFFYERWGDASVHSIAAALMLDKGQIHFFDDIGYHHAPTKSCPRSEATRAKLNCSCKAEENMDWNPSCLKRFFEVAGIDYPEGYDRNVPPELGVLS